MSEKYKEIYNLLSENILNRQNIVFEEADIEIFFPTDWKINVLGKNFINARSSDSLIFMGIKLATIKCFEFDKLFAERVCREILTLAKTENLRFTERKDFFINKMEVYEIMARANSSPEIVIKTSVINTGDNRFLLVISMTQADVYNTYVPLINHFISSIRKRSHAPSFGINNPYISN